MYNPGVYEIPKFFNWAIVGYLVCFMPTFGRGIVRGFHRFIGTLAGSALTTIIAISGELNHLAVFWIMIVVVFTGKFLSLHPTIGYAGIVFALTQLFEIFSTFHSEDTTLLQLIEYRTLCMCIGVGWAMIWATCVFPLYDSTTVRKSFADTVVIVAELLLNSSHGHLALYSVYHAYAPLASACITARAEMKFFRRLKKTSVSRIINAENSLYKYTEMFLMVQSVVDNEVGGEFEIEKILSELKFEFSKASQALAAAIRGEVEITPDCTFDWSKYISRAYAVLTAGPTSHNSVHYLNILFALSQFFKSWENLIHSLNPNAMPRTKTFFDDGLRLSFL